MPCDAPVTITVLGGLFIVTLIESSLNRAVLAAATHAIGLLPHAFYPRNESSSLFTCAACVHSTPCGPPGNSTNLTFLIILACLRDVASGGRMRSASPWMISVGTLLRRMSLRKSSTQASTHFNVPIAEA